MKRAVINDINKDLIDAYITIKEQPYELIEILERFEQEYHDLTEDEENKKEV